MCNRNAATEGGRSLSEIKGITKRKKLASFLFLNPSSSPSLSSWNINPKSNLAEVLTTGILKKGLKPLLGSGLDASGVRVWAVKNGSKGTLNLRSYQQVCTYLPPPPPTTTNVAP